jgi:hypothetical protein
MKSNQPAVCFKFHEKSLEIMVVNPSSGAVTLKETVNTDFQVLDHSGVISEPQELAALIRQLSDKYKLPARARVLLSLKYLDIKYLTLPVMPEAELRQIIPDEAGRESIFSFSGEPVVTAYQLVGEPLREGGGMKRTILTVTAPEKVLHSIIDTFADTGLKLTAVQPSLWGLGQIPRRFPEPDQSFILMQTGEMETEFYIWDKKAPLFWRYLTVGSFEPERLQAEVMTSLEHFQRRSSQPLTIKKLLLTGEKVVIDCGPDIEVQTLAVERPADLWGLGVQDKEDSLNFLRLIPGHTDSSEFSYLPQITPWLLAGFLLLNLALAWVLWMDSRQIAGIRISNAKLEKVLQVKEGHFKNTKTGMETNRPQQLSTEFLQNLRQITPGDLRFETLEFNVASATLRISGITLSHSSFDFFLAEAARINGVKTVEVLDTQEQEKNGTSFYTFELNLKLGVPKHG